MDEITLKDIITFAFSGGALIVSICALAVSIWLPLYLARQAEERAILARNREKLPPFYRKVKEFIVHMNTPGEGYVSNTEYYLSNEAAELGLYHLQQMLLALHRDMDKADELSSKNDGSFNAKGEWMITPEHANINRQIQYRLSAIHDYAERENKLLHHPEKPTKRTLMDRIHRRFNG